MAGLQTAQSARRGIPIGIAFVAVWLMASAYTRPGLVLLGIALAGAVGILFRREIPVRTEPVCDVRRDLRGWARRGAVFIGFLPRFAWLVVRSGVHIARLALRPSLDFWPGIVRIKADMPDRRATTLLSHLITLTPGTVAVDYNEETDDLYVHWIDVAESQEGESLDDRVSGGMRPWIRRLFE